MAFLEENDDNDLSGDDFEENSIYGRVTPTNGSIRRNHKG